LRAKLYQQKRHKEKIQMKKTIRAHEQKDVKSAGENATPQEPLPQYLLDRTNPGSAKALSSAIKSKRAEKAARFSVPVSVLQKCTEFKAGLNEWRRFPKFAGFQRRRCSRP